MKKDELHRLSPENLNGFYKEIAEAFGIEVAFLFFQKYSGIQVTFPVKLYSQEYQHELIRQEIIDGMSIKEIARMHGYSERQIRRVIASIRNSPKE